MITEGILFATICCRAMRSARLKKVEKLHEIYYLPSMTLIATLVFEED